MASVFPLQGDSGPLPLLKALLRLMASPSKEAPSKEETLRDGAKQGRLRGGGYAGTCYARAVTISVSITSYRSLPPVSMNKTLLLREPLPSNPAADTAIPPLIWCSSSLQANTPSR